MKVALKEPIPTGTVRITTKARETLHRNNRTATEFVVRHVKGDFGDVDTSDLMMNQVGLRTGNLVLSCYNLPHGERLWVQTSADRSKTTVSLAGEDM